MTPRRGAIHPLTCRGGTGARPRARGVVVVSENAWNDRMNTVIGVPLYEGPPRVPIFHVAVGDRHVDTSRTQSIAIDDLGRPSGAVATDVLERVAQAASDFLDLPSLAAREIRRPPSGRHPTDRPHQRGVYWTDLGLDERKRVGVVTPDEHNRVASHVTTVRLTSRDKRWRRDFQVPCEGGWIITGDLILRSHTDLDHRRRPRPSEIPRVGMAEVAVRLQGLLGCR